MFFVASAPAGPPSQMIVRMRFLLTALCLIPVSVQAADLPLGLAASQPQSGRFVETDDGFMVPFTLTIPGTDVEFIMEPVPGGEITVGTDQRHYQVEPFWMGRYEVTWAEYKRYMELYETFKQFQINRERQVNKQNDVDAITAPTPLYDPSYTFEFGEDPQQPAITVTQYSAKQYTKWLSAITGLQFRIPAEAEWEHACRAGAKTSYYFGESADPLDEYAWFEDNTDWEGTKKVGQKKPNAWGLYDMHGNAAEWVLDGPDSEEPADGGGILNASTDWIRPTKPDQRKVCGGSWDQSAENCTATSRMLSDHEEWKAVDPNIPKSPWWFTDDPARGVGFRLIRPLRTVEREAMEEYWKIDNESIGWDVFDRLDEGRGVKGLVDRELPEAIKALNGNQ